MEELAFTVDRHNEDDDDCQDGTTDTTVTVTLHACATVKLRCNYRPYMYPAY